MSLKLSFFHSKWVWQAILSLTVILCSKDAIISVFLHYSIQNAFLRFMTVILTIVSKFFSSQKLIICHNLNMR